MAKFSIFTIILARTYLDTHNFLPMWLIFNIKINKVNLMDNKKLKSFLELAECNTFNEASQRLFITQPTLTKHMKQIEYELGGTLFSRDNKGAYLTEEGKLIYQHAKTLNSQLSHFLCVAKKVRIGKTGNLNVSYTPSFVNIIPTIANEFSSCYPNINLKFTEHNSDLQSELLNKGRIDIGLMREPVGENLSFSVVGNDHLSLISHKNIDAVHQNLDEIASKYPILMLDKSSDSDIDSIIVDFLGEWHKRAISVQEVSNIYNIITLVQSQAGGSILPNSMIRFFKPDVKINNLNSPNSNWKVGLAWNQRKQSIQKFATKPLSYSISSNAINE